MPALISLPMAYPPSSSPPASKRKIPSYGDESQHSGRAIALNVTTDSWDNGKSASPPPSKKRLFETEIVSTAHHNAPARMPNVVKKVKQFGAFIDEDSDDENTSARPVIVDDEQSRLTYTPNPAPELHTAPQSFSASPTRKEVRSCTGRIINIRPRIQESAATFESLVAARSTTKAGRAKKSYYGIDIQQLVQDANSEGNAMVTENDTEIPAALPSIEVPQRRPRKTLMWTEKYRAKRFFDLVGDDRTHRDVLRWLKGWDAVVFPKSGKSKASKPRAEHEAEEKMHRKILLLTGPPGLGKTTLAHVCATQAGYEIMEINASDERSSNVVKGRIRTSVGTESVKKVGSAKQTGQALRPVRPVCVVVDEVDGVTSGSGASGDGGFIKALIDLVNLDAKNSTSVSNNTSQARNKPKGDNFKLLRPLVLICNDVYHPSLRPLRQSGIAEIIHMRKPPIEAVANRMKSVFEKEGITADADAVRKLCEATWGIETGPDNRIDAGGTGEGDLRSVLVVGEWAAGRLKSSSKERPRLTREWIEQNMLNSLGHGGGNTRGVGRGGAKEVVSRVFQTGAGFPKGSTLPHGAKAKSTSTIPADGPRTQLHATEIAKKAGMERLREMIDTSGEVDRILNDVFSLYPTQPFNDDTILSKPHAAYEWIHFHDACSSRVYADQDWELMPYLSQSILACHNLFASSARHHHSFGQGLSKKQVDSEEAEDEMPTPFSGVKADYDAKEAEKLARETILELQNNFSPALLRSFRSSEIIATELLPYLIPLLSPEVKPVVIGGSGDQRGIASVRKESERDMVRRAVDVMSGMGVRYERGRLEGDFQSRGTQWVYRMFPPLDDLAVYATAREPLIATSTSSSATGAPVRYAVRQVLDQEHQKNILVRAAAARQARFTAGNKDNMDEDLDQQEARNGSAASSGSGKMSGSFHRNGLEQETLQSTLVKKDFFGRILAETDGNRGDGNGYRKDGAQTGERKRTMTEKKGKVWVSFHEGFSNAVRKPITVDELLRGL